MFLQQPTPTPAQSVREILASLPHKLVEIVPGVFEGALILLVFWIVASIGRRLIAVAAPRVRADTSVVLLLSRLYYYSVLAFGGITALGTAGLDVRALVAGLGLTGFALGFAFKDVLSNFVAGVMLLAYRPFHIGDLIEMGEFAGRIESIRIRDTLVRAEDGRLIIIPNTKLITEVVVNHSDAGRTNARTIRPPVIPRKPAAKPKIEEEDEQPPPPPPHAPDGPNS